ncbi:MAG TPA: MFS transporter [Anaeromyxobacteraceae bacterium]|nr:MFS transporter [Anaeromyxobacteraceae bacterium]
MTWPHALRSLRNRNLRLFFAGQSVSITGSWMQSVAQGWLVWRLTRSPELLGLVGFLSQLPVFLFGVWAGALADRFPRRTVVLCTQVNALTQATLLAVLTFSGLVRPWHLLVLSFMLGLSYAFEIPARQALLGDVAGEDMPNALALNSSIVNGARVVGPAVAGVVVALVGEAWCFALNALSFLGTIRALLVMDLPPQRAPGGRTRLAGGLEYAARTPYVLALLLTLAISSFFGMSYAALLPVFAAEVLGGGAGLYGTLQACAGAGALAGGVSLLLRPGGLRGLGRRVAVGASALGLGLLVVSRSRAPALTAASLVVAGFGYITQTAGTMTLLQGLSPPELRGRVMGLFSTLFVGMTPFGALLGGVAAKRLGAPATLLAGSSVVLISSAALHLRLPALRRSLQAARAASAPPAPEPPPGSPPTPPLPTA